MEVKNKVYQFNKMMKDLIPDKVPEGVYHHGRNIRFVAGDVEILQGFHFEHGNTLMLDIPSPVINYNSNLIQYTYRNFDQEGNHYDNSMSLLHYDTEGASPNNNLPRVELERMYYIESTGEYRQSGIQRVIGYTETRKGVVLFSTDDAGFDCIWFLKINNENEFELRLKYMRDLGFSYKYPIEAINNYESDKVDKIYWVDTKHQLRHLNLEQSIENGDYTELIDMNVDLIEAISSADLSQPVISEINFGGTHTSGMIQYAYSLYKLNGSQTMLSPISDLIPLGKGESEGGGAPNEVVGTAPTVVINNIDTKYDNIVVYAIKYTSLDSTPTVSIIEDTQIPESGQLQIYDNGSVIYNSSIEEIKLINNSLNFPSAIASKDNRLFLANFRENNFKVELDVRAYQFPKNTTPQTSSATIVYDNIYDNNGNITGETRFINGTGPNAFTDDPTDTFDSVNLNYDFNAYRPNSAVRGGEGKYLYFELIKDSKIHNNRKYFKDNEIYRIGIIFYNVFGQTTLPMWISDFKAPQSNLEGRPNILKVVLKPAFYTWLYSTPFDDYNRPVGYKVVVAERTNSDKTILSNGIITSMTVVNNERVGDGYHETYNGNKMVRIYSNKMTEIDNILKHKIKSPAPLFRNAWLQYNKADHEVLLNNPYNLPLVATPNTLMTRLIDSPLQKASHYSALNHVLIEGSYTPHVKFLTEFPLSKDKPNRAWHFQDTKIMQMYSPESVFNQTPVLPADCKLKVRYAFKNSENGTWTRIIATTTGEILDEWKIKNRLSTQLYADLSSNVFPVEWITPSDGSANYSFIAQQARYANTVIFWDGKRYPMGWASAGMFSNFWGDRFGEAKTEAVTKMDLYYRKYGTRIEDINPGYSFTVVDNIINIPNTPITLSGINSYNNTDSLNVVFNESILEEYPTVENIAVETTVTVLNPSGFRPGLISASLGLNGSQFQKLSLDGKGATTFTALELIPVSTLADSPTIQNSLMFDSMNPDEVVEGNLSYEMNITMLDNNDATLATQSINSIINYVNIGINTQASYVLNGSPNIVKPNADEASLTYNIYGRPVVTRKGQSTKDYNGDAYFKFNNTLAGITSNDLGGTDNSTDKAIRTFNGEAAGCVTFVLNPATEFDNKSAIAYEDLVRYANFNVNNFRSNVGTVYCDIVRSDRDIYLGGIYGGSSHEDKKRTTYLEVGDYKNIDVNTNVINSPGDTYVQNFKFLRISRGSVDKLSPSTMEYEEIVEFPTETTIDLMNRNDLSFTQWDGRFSYEEVDYHKYNLVYSQKNRITATRDLDYTFKEVNLFGANVRASRLKMAGEIKDSFLQSLVNEDINLDGKYGVITRLLNSNDVIYAMQEKAVSMLSINPRVQITTAEGSEVQLGTGQVLDDYKYITTESGSQRWSCVATPNGVYYVDARNKAFNSITSEGIKELSKAHGMKKFFMDNIDFMRIENGNMLENQGFILGYDKVRKDIYITHKGVKHWTLAFNVDQDGFSSFYDYNSDFYIPINHMMLTINPNYNVNTPLYNTLYLAFSNKASYFYDEVKPVEFTFIANPEYLVENTFHNLEYIDRCYDENKKEVVKTFDTIRATNPFQDSGNVSLVPRINIRKLNRKWRLNIPRENNKVHRIRNNWAMITLISNNTEGLYHEIHDIILHYTPNYKDLQ